MKIIILGAGQVGSSMADILAGEANDVTLVDTDAGVLRMLQDRLDIRTVVGNAAYPHVLTQAGAEDADLLLAVTNSDEVNMVACTVAARGELYSSASSPKEWPGPSSLSASVSAAAVSPHVCFFSTSASPPCTFPGEGAHCPIPLAAFSAFPAQTHHP